MKYKIEMPTNKGYIEFKIIDIDKFDVNKLCSFHDCDDIKYCKYCAFLTSDNYKKWQEQNKKVKKVKGA